MLQYHVHFVLHFLLHQTNKLAINWFSNQLSSHTFSASSSSAILAVESTLTFDPNTLILSVSMEVFATRILAFSNRLGWLTPTFFSRRKPTKSCPEQLIRPTLPSLSPHPPPFQPPLQPATPPSPFSFILAPPSLQSLLPSLQSLFPPPPSPFSSLPTFLQIRIGHPSPQLLDNLDGLQIPGPLQPQNGLHSQRGKVLLVMSQQLRTKSCAGNIHQVLTKGMKQKGD